MTHPALIPTPIETPEPITPLDAALARIADDTSKVCHLEPCHRDALRRYIVKLEYERAIYEMARANN